MIRNEFVQHILEDVCQCADELRDALDSITSAEEGETLFPQSDEERELRDELARILIQLTPALDHIEEIHDFYQGLSNAFGTYNPA